ncbi:hypothetical protein [Haloarchaeobius salinus]|uniref:hypothetical protein n=1 Tax=Haloarchaeobius salinus TaxID=1198298 RepID=UPI00210AEAA6|nr:hypothetical protein [Haloarchaeobius salinus]
MDEVTEGAFEDALDGLKARQIEIYKTEQDSSVEKISNLIPEVVIEHVSFNTNQFK